MQLLVLVWIGLLMLLAGTAAVSLLPLPEIHPLINLLIALAKTILIGLFFMHLRGASNLVRLIALAGFVWIALLIGLSYSDFATRAVSPLAR